MINEQPKGEQAKLTPFQMMESYLYEHYAFLHNVVLNKVEYLERKGMGKGEIDDYKLNSILSDLLRKKIHVTKSQLTNYLFSDSSEQYDPLKDYFDELSPWRSFMPDYIQMLADTVTVPEEQREMWSIYLRRWLIATVGCAINKDVTNQQVLVLVGEQGIGKTKWTERLVPKQLQGYYHSGALIPGDKDSSINQSECFLINLDELGYLNRGDLNSLKQMITQTSVRIRRPYAAIPETMPRRASFIGSVNNRDFLRDDTGNRRYLCVEALGIDYNHTIDIDKVFAQAYNLFESGEQYWFAGDDINAINALNKQYQVSYPELEYVNEFFEPCGRDDKDAVEMTVTQIQEYLRRHGANILNVGNRMLGIALKSSDYVRIKKNGGAYYYKLKHKPKPLPRRAR